MYHYQQVRKEPKEHTDEYIMSNTDSKKKHSKSAIGVLNLISVDYFKVNYQKMITMAESRLLKCTIINRSEKNLKNILMNI